MIRIIAALTQNRGIGIRGALAWKSEEEMQHFVKQTTGHTIIMGRKTYESIGRPLPNRTNIVVSKTLKDSAVIVCETFLEALEKANDDAYIIGGAQIYKQALRHADKLCLSWMKQTYETDIFFPEIGEEWIVIKEEEHSDFVYKEYEKATSAPDA